MEDIKQYIQNVTSDSNFNTSTPDPNILDTAYDTPNYIKEFLQPHYSYNDSPTTQDNLNTDIRTEDHDPIYDTTNALDPNASSTATLLSNSTKVTSNFLSTNSPETQREDHTSLSNYTTSDSPISDPSHLTYPYPTKLTT